MVPRAGSETRTCANSEAISMCKFDPTFCELPELLTLSATFFAQGQSCPDSANCARLLEEKWKQAYQAVFRFGKIICIRLVRSRSRLVWSLRTLPAVNGLPLPTHSRGRQSSSLPYASRLPVNRQGIHLCAYVITLVSLVPHLTHSHAHGTLCVRCFTSCCAHHSVRPHVLPRRARQRDGHRPARRSRRRRGGRSTYRSPQALPLLLAPPRARRTQQALSRANMNLRHHPYPFVNPYTQSVTLVLLF